MGGIAGPKLHLAANLGGDLGAARPDETSKREPACSLAPRIFANTTGSHGVCSIKTVHRHRVYLAKHAPMLQAKRHLYFLGKPTCSGAAQGSRQDHQRQWQEGPHLQPGDEFRGKIRKQGRDSREGGRQKGLLCGRRREDAELGHSPTKLNVWCL